MTKSKSSLIYGNGMLARALAQASPSGGAFFAAGVSNSIGATEEDYQRETDEVESFIKMNNKQKIVYFSSFTAINGNSRYAEHKRSIENLINEHANDYAIIRLPQVAGITKNNTMLSFFVHQIICGKSLKIQKSAKRRLIDIADVVRIAEEIVINYGSRSTINIGPNFSLTASEIVSEISKILNIEPNIILIDGGDEQHAQIDDAVGFLGISDKIFNSDYQHVVIKKYVPKIVELLS